MKYAILLLLLTATTTVSLNASSPGIPAPKDIGKGWFSPGIPTPCMPGDYRETCKAQGY